MKVMMKNQFGALKEVKVGFSWTMLFFGFFVPLLRGDWKWAVFSLCLSLITCGVCWFVLPFFYNKIYIKGLIEKGWVPADKTALDAIRSKKIYVPEQAVMDIENPAPVQQAQPEQVNAEAKEQSESKIEQ